MYYTLYDLIAFVLTLGGLLAGFFGGLDVEKYGIFWGVVGGVVGCFVGNRIGQLPNRLQIRKARRDLAEFTNDQLREQLHKWAYGRLESLVWTPNFLLAELRARGEDISAYLGLVLEMLESEVCLRRVCGAGALLTGWPELVQYVRGYRAERAVAECRAKVAKLREAIEAEMKMEAGERE